MTSFAGLKIVFFLLHENFYVSNKTQTSFNFSFKDDSTIYLKLAINVIQFYFVLLIHPAE